MIEFRKRTLWLIGCLCLLGFSGCQFVPAIELPDILGTPTPQPMPTPVGDTLDYNITGNNFDVTIGIGQTQPGTLLTFVDKQSSDIFNVKIDGLDAVKRPGDSFNWQGIVAPGTYATYLLQLLPSLNDVQLLANGSVTVSIFDPTPREATFPERNDSSLIYQNIEIDYLIPQGVTMPGTTLVFDREESGLVTFSGTEGFPQYALGDSLRWEGFLRDNVFVTHDLKLIGMETNGLRVQGTATLRVFTAPLTTTP